MIEEYIPDLDNPVDDADLSAVQKRYIVWRYRFLLELERKVESGVIVKDAEFGYVHL